MNHIHFLFGVWLMAILSLSACSQQYRKAEPGIDSGTLISQIESLSSFGANDSELSIFHEIASARDTSSVYYAESGVHGPVESLLAMTPTALSELGVTEVHSPLEIASARVYFVDNRREENRQIAIAIEYEVIGDDRMRAAVQSADRIEFSKSKISAQFGNIILYTYDTQEKTPDLADVIQIKIKDLNGTSLGKISTLVGFFGDSDL